MSLGKKVRYAAAAFLMLLSTVTPMGGALLRNAYAVANDAPWNQKKIYDNGDGTYTIALSVKGETSSSTTSQITKANVVLVIDTSNSMNQSSGSTTEYVYTEFTDDGIQGNEYYGKDEEGDYFRVYWRNKINSGTSHWRTTNNNGGQEYTGTVYTRSGGTALSRIQAEKDALTKTDGIVDKLVAQNVPGDANKSDIIEVAIVNFGTRGSTAQDWTTSGDTLKTTINGLTTSTGTNWDEALSTANHWRMPKRLASQTKISMLSS